MPRLRPFLAAAAAAILLLVVYALVRPSADGTEPERAVAPRPPTAATAPSSDPPPAPRRAPEPPTPGAEPHGEAVADEAPSDEVVSGWLREAETAFEGGDLATATDGYRRIVEEAPDAKVAPYALYKLGWCEFNGGRSDEAIRAMQMLIDWAEQGNVHGADALAKEAAKDIADFRRKPGR